MAKTLDFNLASPCGTYCGECRYLGNTCKGCGYVKGKPFWGECRFYSCTKEKGIEHCGVCDEFPCDYFLSTYDPNEGKSRLFFRAGQLVYRRKIGTRAWLEEKTKGEDSDSKREE